MSSTADTTTKTDDVTATSNAKHLHANTFGRNPHLMPYILSNNRPAESPAAGALRSKIETESRAIMSGSPDEAMFFAWLLPLLGAKKVLEVGVFRGATTLALALALPADGKVVGLDISEEFVSTARPFWAQAQVDGKIDIIIGSAVESMEKMLANGQEGTFSFVFIDADKVNYPTYYELALKLLHKGGVIAVDNCLWGGSTMPPLPPDADADTRALSSLNDKIKADPRVAATMLPIADGVYMVRKL